MPVLHGPNSTESNLFHHEETTYTRKGSMNVRESYSRALEQGTLETDVSPLQERPVVTGMTKLGCAAHDANGPIAQYLVSSSICLSKLPTYTQYAL